MSTSPSGAPVAPPAPAILVQRYRLERKLAQGGMAEVWLGTDLSLSRQVAIKLLKPALAADPVVAERFRREAIAVAQLSHPNIVTVYDAIEDHTQAEPRQAVVMQLINGKSLRQLLDEKKRLSPDLTMHIGVGVAAALDCAHRAHLVHRDVKPGNILVTADGQVLLTDFGIAKGMFGHDGDDLTSPNVMMGTAKYLSPEQVQGEKLDGRADLYSLGLVLYECLAGRVPFLGETETDTALARLHRDPTNLHQLRPTLPPGLAELIHRLLSRSPNKRPPSGAAVRDELQRIEAAPRPTFDDATRQATPPRGRSTPVTTRTPAAAVGGYQPVTTGRPVGAAVRPADRTPPATARPRQQPNRAYEHSTRPSTIVVTGLLLVAAVVAFVLWASLQTGDSSGAPPVTTLSPVTESLPTDPNATSPTATGPNGSSSEPGAGGVPSSAAVVGPATRSVSTFDPGGDGEERDDLVPLALDGDMNTAWTTVCYDNQYLGGKRGTGVVLDLGVASTGMFTAAIGSAPYQVAVYGAPDGARPTTLSAWGTPAERFDGLSPGAVSYQFSSPVRYVLLTFDDLGSDPGCSGDRYRGSVQELGFG